MHRDGASHQKVGWLGGRSVGEMGVWWGLAPKKFLELRSFAR